jgi:hypothetical protein
MKEMGITKYLYWEGDENFEVMMRSCDQRDANFHTHKIWRYMPICRDYV